MQIFQNFHSPAPYVIICRHASNYAPPPHTHIHLIPKIDTSMGNTLTPIRVPTPRNTHTDADNDYMGHPGGCGLSYNAWCLIVEYHRLYFHVLSWYPQCVSVGVYECVPYPERGGHSAIDRLFSTI